PLPPRDIHSFPTRRSSDLLKEILVVASGCTDGTERVVEDWAGSEPRLRLIREAERSGKASALNAILARFRGDILVLVNADTRLPDRKSTRLNSSYLVISYA